MIPALFANDAKTFSTLGMGSVPEAVECYVEEERNGGFILNMRVPATASYAAKINVGTLIVADASPQQKRQAFEIVKVTKALNNMIQVYAEHVSYRLLYSILKPFPSAGIDGLNNVFNRLSDNHNGSYYDEGNDFTFTWSGWDSAAANTKLDEHLAVKTFLFGKTGSVLDVYGGCYKWDNFTVILYKERGTDNGIRITYGRNLTDINAEYSNENESSCNGVMPLYKNSDKTLFGSIKVPENDPDVRYLYSYRRTIVKDFTSDITVNEGETDAQIITKLNNKAQAWINKDHKGYPTVNLKTSFVPLSQTVEYRDLANLESVEIDDTVHVYVPTLDVDVAAKIIKTRYNVLLDRYDSVEVGNFKTTINQAIRSVKGV